MKTEQIYEQIEKLFEEDGRAYLKLIARVDQAIRKWKLHHRAKFIEAPDLVHEAITKICDSKRAWDAERHPILEDFIYCVVISLIKNYERKSKKFVYACDLTGKNNEEDEEYDYFETVPSETMDEINSKEERGELIERMYQILGDETEEYCVFDEIIKGNKNQEIATSLGIEVREVENIKKRIVRKIKKVLIEKELRKNCVEKFTGIHHTVGKCL